MPTASRLLDQAAGSDESVGRRKAASPLSWGDFASTALPHTLTLASREALSARQPGSSTVARRCGPAGARREHGGHSMSTTTIEVLERAPSYPEWRRLCHYYFPGTLCSACGTARRPPGEGHDADECAARGHTI